VSYYEGLGPVSVERDFQNLPTVSWSGIGSTTGGNGIPSGTKVALCGMAYKSTAAGHSGVIRLGDETTSVFIMQVFGGELAISCHFYHPIILDGLNIVVSAGVGEWTLWYKTLGSQ
jgi:hypothetical protein